MRLGHLMEVALALAPTAATAQTASPIVIGQSYPLASKIMGVDRTINVYLPPSYATSTARYPVVYLLDGGVAQDFHHISGLAQLGPIADTMREVIVVGIETVDRQSELTFKPVHDAKLAADYPNAGRSARFRRFVADEVKPWVAAHYRTDDDDALMGESLAGLFVVETLLREPGLFRRYVAVSPSLWWDNGALNAAAPPLIAGLGDRERWLYLTVANERGMGVDTFAEALKAAPKSLHWRFVPRPRETHGTTFHYAALEALRVFYPASEAK